MKIKIFITFVLIILASLFSGCIGETPEETPVPTDIPVETEQPTPIPTIPSPTPTPAVELQTTYIVWVDGYYGFYRVMAFRGNLPVDLPPDFNILNISINAGDNVTWMNDDSNDFPLTLVSNEGLWTGRTGYMRWQGDLFEYTFNESGTYTFSILEEPRISNQTINVIS
ncbi:MAG: hypothetical protein IBX39_10575 [Candidatus Methanoperedenaceae archaeon]|nr:hypothetical protein [Candidatus Methanoperedenaceae archaeon]